MEKRKKALNFILSATAPEMMVAAVAVKTTWKRNGAVNALVSVPGSWAIICSAQQPETVGPYKAVSVAEHQTPSQQKEGERGEGEDNEILGQDVDRVLSPAESRLQHREPQGHKHHKKCRH